MGAFFCFSPIKSENLLPRASEFLFLKKYIYESDHYVDVLH